MNVAMIREYATSVLAIAAFCEAAVIEKLHSQHEDFHWYLSKAKTFDEAIRKDTEAPYFASTKELGAVRALPHVETSSGTVIGRSMDQSHAFYSIPYGQVPQRYMPPQPAGNQGSVNASEPNYLRCFASPAICDDQGNCNKNYNEECLVLNVFVPAAVDLSDPSSSKLPVMFWIHGGGFSLGTGTARLYDGTLFSNTTNTVMVAINYRLDALGFLVHEEGNTKFEGNQGLKDQQLAMQWVQDNIEKFGGDKNEVTIFGNSAGAQSVMMHLISDISKPLFKRALMQSNPAVFYYQTPAEAKWVTDVLVEALGCNSTVESTTECLLQRKPEEIVNVRPIVKAAARVAKDIYSLVEPYRPIIDGNEFKDQPLNLFRDGKWQNDKEVLLGTQSDELGNIDILFENRHLSSTSFTSLNTEWLGEYYGNLIADAYKELDNLGDQDNYGPTLADETADMLFVCPSRALARFMSQTSAFAAPPPIYLYVNEHGREEDLAVHGEENYFVFGNGFNYSADDELVVEMFSDYWGEFAHTGHPSSDVNVWPPYIPQTQQGGIISSWSNIRIVAPASIVETDYRKEYCDFWDSIGFYVNITTTDEPTTPDPDSSTTVSEDATSDTTTLSVEDTVPTTSSVGRTTACIWSGLLSISVLRNVW